jgi:hypothetical protein
LIARACALLKRSGVTAAVALFAAEGVAPYYVSYFYEIKSSKENYR